MDATQEGSYTCTVGNLQKRSILEQISRQRQASSNWWGQRQKRNDTCNACMLGLGSCCLDQLAQIGHGADGIGKS